MVSVVVIVVGAQSGPTSVAATAQGSPARHRCRRGVVAAALAGLLGVASWSPALAAAAPVAGVLVDRHGPSAYQGDAQPWAADYYGPATAVSQPATAAQSAGVVVIDTVLPYQNAKAAGTGMVLTSSGQVLTNYHVVAGAGTITATVPQSGQTYQATVVGSDPTDDVALLQLSAASGLRTVTIDDDQLAVGDAVTAVGNAEGTGSLTAATGTISSLTASVTAADEGSAASETLSSMIETTADVVSGDSGGPLFDTEGEVVGIDTAASTGRQIDGYAIPIDRALAVVAQIRSGTETGAVQIGSSAFLGVELSSQSAMSRSGYLSGGATASSGALLGGVVEGSAAANTGLRAGDVITTVDGRVISSAADLSAVLATLNPGDQVRIAWISSAGGQQNATITLGASPVA